MPALEPNHVQCPQCGHTHAATRDGCPVCGAQVVALDGQPIERGDRSKDRDRLKTQWVAAVGAFWVSTAVLVAVFFLQGRVNLLLVSICLGLMILGIGTKIRYRLHRKKDPGGS